MLLFSAVLRRVALALSAVLILVALASAQSSGIIRADWQRFLKAAHTWVGEQSFDDVTVTGTCTGCGGGGAPGGMDGEVQFNDGGAFGGDAGFTYNKTLDALTVGGSIHIGAGSEFTATSSLLELEPSEDERWFIVDPVSHWWAIGDSDTQAYTYITGSADQVILDGKLNLYLVAATDLYINYVPGVTGSTVTACVITEITKGIITAATCP